MTVIVDSRQQVFEEPPESFSTFDFSSQPIPDLYGMAIIEADAYPTLPEDNIFQNTFSSINVTRFGNNFLDQILPSTFSLTAIDSEVSPVSSTSPSSTFSDVRVTTFGERSIATKLNLVAKNTTGEVWTSLVATSLSRTALIESYVTDYASNNAKVGSLGEDFALNNTAAFGTGEFGEVRQNAVALEPTIGYSFNKIVIDTNKAFGYVVSNVIVPTTITVTSANNVNAVSLARSFAFNSSYFAVARLNFTASKPATLASGRTARTKQDVKVAQTAQKFSFQKINAFEGFFSTVASGSFVVDRKRTFAKSNIVIPKSLIATSRSRVNIVTPVIDIVTNNVKISTGPSYRATRNIVFVQNANSTLNNGSQLSNDVFRDPLFYEYVFGFDYV